MEPMWQLLRADGARAKLSWQEKGCLKSAMANRQFPQTRVEACGWSEHDRCILCLHKIVEEEHTGGRSGERAARDGLRERSKRHLAVQNTRQAVDAMCGHLKTFFGYLAAAPEAEAAE